MSAVPASLRRRPSRGLAQAAVGAGIVVLIATAALTVLSDVDRRHMELVVQSPLGLVGLFVLSALSSATLLLPVPGMALTVIAAPLAHPLLVGFLAGMGQATGELTGYVAGWSGRAVAGDRLTVSRMGDWMRRRGMATLFLLALVPNPVFDVAGMIAGALRMSLPRYLIAAGAGKVARNTLIAWSVVQGATLLAA